MKLSGKRQVPPPALKVKPDSNGTGRGTAIRLPKVPQKSLNRSLWHPDPARASGPCRGHSPAIAQVTRKRPTPPRWRRRRGRHDVMGRRGGAGVARHRRPGRRRRWIGRVWRAVGPWSRDLLLGHEPRGRRRGDEVSPAAMRPCTPARAPRGARRAGCPSKTASQAPPRIVPPLARK